MSFANCMHLNDASYRTLACFIKGGVFRRAASFHYLSVKNFCNKTGIHIDHCCC